MRHQYKRKVKPTQQKTDGKRSGIGVLARKNTPVRCYEVRGLRSLTRGGGLERVEALNWMKEWSIAKIQVGTLGKRERECWKIRKLVSNANIVESLAKMLAVAIVFNHALSLR